MKKLIALILIALLLLALTGCGGSVDTGSSVSADDTPSKVDETIVSMEDALLEDVKAACSSAGINISDYSFTENRKETKIGSDNGTYVTMDLTLTTDTDMASMSYADIFAIFFKNSGEYDVDRNGNAPIAYQTSLASITSANATYSASCWKSETSLEKNELYIRAEDGSEQHIGFYDLFNHESTFYTRGVKAWIEAEYERYDELAGEYTGDKYTNTIFAEASEKFGLPVDYIKLHVW